MLVCLCACRKKRFSKLFPHVDRDGLDRQDNPAISVNSLSAIQKALEENGIEFLDGARSISLKVREKRGLVGLAIVIDPTMPLGTRFTSVSPSSVS